MPVEQKTSVVKTSGRLLWGLIKFAIALAILFVIVSLYQDGTWLSMLYKDGQFENGLSHSFAGNAINSFLNSFHAMFSGQVLFGIAHFFAPLIALSIWIGIASSMGKTSTTN